MTQEESYRVLGLMPGSDIKEIKKKYRKLMHRLHPDAAASSKERYPYSVHEINTAYAVLKKGSEDGIGRFGKENTAEKVRPGKHWDGLINEHAYREREILHYAEDQDGNPIGIFAIDRGKYLWKTDEDFPLFLRSIYQCSREILDEIDAAAKRKQPEERRLQVQAQLMYLLAQQYIDGTAMLKELALKRAQDETGEIFYIQAMLEEGESGPSAKEGEPLYPSRLKDHKLYLKNVSGRELGYLSFQDDRLYYVMVPLFEQRRVQVRIRTAKGAAAEQRKRNGGIQKLHLWLRLPKENAQSSLESLDLKIRQLLENYRT